MVKYTDIITNNLVNGYITVIEAIKQLDECEIKVLFIVDNNNKIEASLTDGDIRRAILKGISLDTPISEVANYNPSCLLSFEREEAETIIKSKMIEAIPLLDEYDRVTSIAYYGFDSEECNPIVECPVVIMAGGKGKRLFPYTKILPKPLIPIDDTPISQRIIEAFIKLGCKDFHIIVNYKKNMIKAYYADAGIDAKISFVDEDTPLGTGGGLKLLEGKLDETFVLTNCDILIMANLSDIIEHHRNQHNSVTMVCSLKDFEIPYGVVNFEEGGEIKSFEEKPKMSFFTNTGYYILEPEIMNYINDNEVIGMPDIIERMRTDGKKVGIYPISESSWLDMGQFDSMEGMERRLKELRMD